MILKRQISLSPYTTFGIGGRARFFYEVHSQEELRNALLYCTKEKLPYLILGKGSNCLINDQGFEGLVILNKIDNYNIDPHGHVTVGAGYSFSLLGTYSARLEWSGLEFASGIPGSIGGAIFMNAGANGKETCEVVESIDFMYPDGTTRTFTKEEANFSYRHSIFQTIPGSIIGATFQLKHDPQARTRQLEIIEYRKKTQPLKSKSAGCIFRNPQGCFAGAIIEQLGLKGTSIGGAQVSPVHANFIVNTGNSTAQDVVSLINLIKNEAQNKANIALNAEIRYIGVYGNTP